MDSDRPDVDGWVLAYFWVDFDKENPWRRLKPEAEWEPMTRERIFAAIREKFGDATARSVRLTVH